jgi:hypothetical protein
MFARGVARHGEEGVHPTDVTLSLLFAPAAPLLVQEAIEA